MQQKMYCDSPHDLKVLGNAVHFLLHEYHSIPYLCLPALYVDAITTITLPSPHLKARPSFVLESAILPYLTVSGSLLNDCHGRLISQRCENARDFTRETQGSSTQTRVRDTGTSIPLYLVVSMTRLSGVGGRKEGAAEESCGKAPDGPSVSKARFKGSTRQETERN